MLCSLPVTTCTGTEHGKTFAEKNLGGETFEEKNLRGFRGFHGLYTRKFVRSGYNVSRHGAIPCED